jgi:AraC-like DNA-binding protein
MRINAVNMRCSSALFLDRVAICRVRLLRRACGARTTHRDVGATQRQLHPRTCSGSRSRRRLRTAWGCSRDAADRNAVARLDRGKLRQEPAGGSRLSAKPSVDQTTNAQCRKDRCSCAPRLSPIDRPASASVAAAAPCRHGQAIATRFPHPLAERGCDCGFANRSRFTCAFTRAAGISPGQLQALTAIDVTGSLDFRQTSVTAHSRRFLRVGATSGLNLPEYSGSFPNEILSDAGALIRCRSKKGPVSCLAAKT